ncbi:hypothetical protein LUZ60_002100 [Juncus effusus]|nr:hypothetical protein LUZ60_002100 [Juncus effusus]
MKDRRMDRFVILPFSVGCVSQSSVAVVETRSKKAHGDTNGQDANIQEMATDDKTKHNGSVIATGIQRIVKSFKTFSSQLFQVYDEEDEETEMVIGLPTDVQHVAHIGWDGLSNNSNSTKKWMNGGAHEPEILSLSSSSLSMRQLELAMAGVSSTNHGPLMV